ncbi:MAG: 4-hydroxy-tetrahydrodipicolinate synthase [Dysgonamonadaceae bacterium]|jgi:4-hydroxy-tetrahydrodipicolinate synthase|nr:4-hydroxy-tetrahydrodipicolinate synthase [Dysgonamonadaceae bacterium]
MRQINLKGMGVAMVTPFKSNGDVDYIALLRLIDYQLQNGTDYLVVLGTTAETPTLTEEEQKEITRLIIDRVNGQIPVILGIGGNNTQAVIDKLKTIDYHKIDAILSVVPYYNKPSQEGIYQHYKHIAKATPLPLILYNVPGRTGTNMSAETTLRLAHDFNNIIGIKEASGNITQVSDIIKNKPGHFQIISGDDGITFPLITLGVVGVISVIGNALPKEFGKMVRMALSGDYANALAIHHNFMELFELLNIDGNPAGVKSLLNIMGYAEKELRLPLISARITTYEKIRNALRKLNVSCREE